VFSHVLPQVNLWSIQSMHLTFYRAAECRCGLAMSILSVLLSVCLPVCLSVKRVNCDKMEETSVQIFISYEIIFILVF